MFLDDLRKSRVIQLSEIGQTINIRNQLGQVLFHQLKIQFRGKFIFVIVIVPSRLDASLHQIFHLLLCSFDSFYNLFALDPLKGKDLVEFPFESGYELLLVLLGPWSSLWSRILGCRRTLVGCLEFGF